MARKRQEQAEIPGFERAKVPEVEEAAENYRAFRDEHIEIGEKAKNAKLELINKMKEHGLTVFAYLDEEGNERKVTLSTKENAKVSKVAARGDDSTDSSGDNVDVH